MALQLSAIPIRTIIVPDFAEIAALAAAHGALQIPLVDERYANRLHAGLHEFGLGVRKLKKDGVHVDWIVGPLLRNSKRPVPDAKEK